LLLSGKGNEKRSDTGLYANGRLWLFGGSQVDMYAPGNKVYSVPLTWRPGNPAPPDLPQWVDHGPAKWEPRMGHGVVWFKSRIWIIGGLDQNGNPLQEVWSMAVPSGTLPARRQPKWERSADAPWPPRCMLQPVVFDNKVWLFGGVKQPGAATTYQDMWTFDGTTWAEQRLTGSIFNQRQHSTAGALVVDHSGRLCLFVKRETSNAKDQSRLSELLGFRLDPRLQVWTCLDTDRLHQDQWGGNDTFSLQIINFRKRMLAARALRPHLDGEPVPPLWLHVNRKGDAS